MGPVMIDVTGLELTAEDRERLRHPLVGGIILFARNYASPEQLKALTQSIRALRSPSLLIAVDHEGGRVQRFRDGFTKIPPMRTFGQMWDKDPAKAKEMTKKTGYVIGAELLAHAVDFSFAPVLDLDYGESSVIGDRSFHRNPVAITELAKELIAGFAEAGMGWVGKHFPGHGFVRADSHHEVPIDNRSFDEIERDDLIPFRELASTGMGGIMPAHVIYPDVDALPAGFSSFWLKDILRDQLAFDGVIFSDDLSMEGASTAGGVVERASAALAAGCDMVLLCNNAQQADKLLAGLKVEATRESIARCEQMRANPTGQRIALKNNPRYATCLSAIKANGIA
jgi:beta-N-acetylhexosaminidase